MTVPEERESDPLVLDLLGFGTPAALEPAAPQPAASPPSTDLAPTGAALTRRELRERERAVEIAEPQPRRSGPPSSPRAKAKPRRAAKSSMRRDAVRVASGSTGKKSFGKRLLSFGAMLFAGAFAFGMTAPAFAFDWSGAGETQLADTLAMPAQSLAVDPSLVSFSERDTWSVTSWAEMLRLRYGNISFDYEVGNGPIRWPFPYPVPISSGFGDRAAPCRGCSTQHSGLDFNPGWGAAIFAIADGVVYEHGESGTSWGNYVIIKHEIDGHVTYSGYAHMQSGSSPMKVGQEVVVGDFVGLVGMTGQATGAHLHFTISIDEPMRYVDPFTFLKTYAS